MPFIKCNCKKKTSSIKVYADYGSDPIWCSLCDFNFDLDHFSLSEEFKNEIIDWVSEYGRWLDWENDILLENAVLIEHNHNIDGKRLTEKLKLELGNNYTITFVEANIVDIYSK